MAQISRRQLTHKRPSSLAHVYLTMAVFVLIAFIRFGWKRGFFSVQSSSSDREPLMTLTEWVRHGSKKNDNKKVQSYIPTGMKLLSVPEHAHVTTDVRGNLGPASVLIQQDTNKTDWLRDRWQAASDMHGTEIVGPHWVNLEFDVPVVVTSIILDWETAYSSDYSMEGKSLDDANKEKVEFVLNSRDTTHLAKYQTVREFGISPGVPEQKLPLHVVHTWNMTSDWEGSGKQVHSLKILIRSPFHKGWGVSLWKVDVYGYRPEQ